jgi:pyrimidine operon attenuation protein/uracil phosphoribosyltransferase
MDKVKPLARPIEFSGDLRKLKGKSVVIIDDVINSGKTLMYGAMHLLNAEPKSLTTACLVDRFHRTFPIRSDFAGLTLSTNLKEHIHVDYLRNKWSVSLQ